LPDDHSILITVGSSLPNHSLDATLDGARFAFDVENLILLKVRMEEYPGASAQNR
jgi:hypothetical protein